MVKKVQKINKKAVSKEKKKNGFKFGRNLGSFLIVIGGLILLALAIFIPYSYISTYTANKVVPFESQSLYTEYMEAKEAADKDANSQHTYKPVERIKGSDFNKLDTKFYCKKYNADKKTAQFSIQLKWNSNTTNLSESSEKLNLLPSSSNKNISVGVGLVSNWVKMEKYEQVQLYVNSANDTSYNKKDNIVISDLLDFPVKANTWPIKVKVGAPTAYVFISYSYDYMNKTENGSTGGVMHEAYILEYSYNEFMTADSEPGGIRG